MTKWSPIAIYYNLIDAKELASDLKKQGQKARITKNVNGDSVVWLK